MLNPNQITAGRQPAPRRPKAENRPAGDTLHEDSETLWRQVLDRLPDGGFGVQAGLSRRPTTIRARKGRNTTDLL